MKHTGPEPLEHSTRIEEQNIDYIQSLPKDIFNVIFGKLGIKAVDLVNASKVSMQWHDYIVQYCKKSTQKFFPYLYKRMLALPANESPNWIQCFAEECFYYSFQFAQVPFEHILSALSGDKDAVALAIKKSLEQKPGIYITQNSKQKKTFITLYALMLVNDKSIPKLDNDLLLAIREKAALIKAGNGTLNLSDEDIFVIQPANLDEAWINATARGHVNLAKYLKERMDLYEVDIKHWHSITQKAAILAAKLGYIHILESFKINYLKDCVTAAAGTGRRAMVAFCCSKLRDELFFEAIEEAAKNGHVEVTLDILKHVEAQTDKVGRVHDVHNFAKRNAFNCAAEYGHINLVKELYDELLQFRWPLAFRAIINNQIEVIRFLLTYHPDQHFLWSKDEILTAKKMAVGVIYDLFEDYLNTHYPEENKPGRCIMC